MFDNLSHWTWVAAAWLQVALAYGGYLLYLRWRTRRLLADDRARRVIERQGGP